LSAALSALWSFTYDNGFRGEEYMLPVLILLNAPMFLISTFLHGSVPEWLDISLAILLNAVIYAVVGVLLWIVGSLLPGGHFAERIRLARRDKYFSDHQQ
jgi:hypothetical protein